MDFISFIRDQSEKLNSRHYLNLTWSKIKGNALMEEDSNQINEYNKHLPLLLEQFWELALEKVVETQYSISEFDEELKIYLLVLIYHTTSQSDELMSFNCLIYASEVYLYLLASPESEEFFQSIIFKNILNVIETAIEETCGEHSIFRLMHKLRLFLVKSKLSTNDLEITLAMLTQLLFIKSNHVISDFQAENESESISFEILLALKHLLINEAIPSRIYFITIYLFNGLRKSNVHLTANSMKIVQINYRNLIRHLHFKFEQDHYKLFLNAFIHVWKHTELQFYDEAVLIMNDLKEEYYRILLDILNKQLSSTQVHKNLFKLAFAIINNPPEFNKNEKTVVNNQILIHNIMMNCLAKKSDISNCALETFAQILQIPNKSITSSLNNLLNFEDSLNVVTILRGFHSLVNKKWSNRARNKHLFAIIISIILYSNEDYPKLYAEILELLSEEVSPYDIKTYIPLMSEVYLKLNERNFRRTSQEVLKIIFKMALHPMATSADYVKYLYLAMTNPCKGDRGKTELFIGEIVSNDYNFKEFFQKCHALGLIKKEHVTKIMENVESITESNWKLLGAIVQYSNYRNLAVIARFINNNFETLHTNPNLNYIFYVYNKIMKNNPQTFDHERTCNNEIVMSFIKFHLFAQNFHWQIVANAFSLFRNFSEYTNMEEEFQRLKQEYDKRLGITFEEKTNFLPILYSSQLVLFGKLLPNDSNLSSLVNILEMHSNPGFPKSIDFNEKLWIGCLFLFTNISFIKNSYVDDAIKFIQVALDCSITSVKLAAVNMLFDLSNMVTHSFDDLINFMFVEIVDSDEAFKQTCLVKIDRLIRDDYLKLDLQQYLKFISVLGDGNFYSYLNQLLSENFFINNTSVMAKFFAPLIVHLNGYRKHPLYELSNADYHSIQILSKKIIDRKKLYSILISHLPVKLRFNVINTLSSHILDTFIHNKIKYDDGLWNLIKDSIVMYKLLTLNTNQGLSNQEYYRKITGLITKHLVQNGEFTENPNYSDHHKEIRQSTIILLKLFFCENENLQKQVKITVFDSIVNWTEYLFADLSHIIHVDRCKEMQDFYAKFVNYYKKNAQDIVFIEEHFNTFSTNMPSTSLYFCRNLLKLN